MYQEKKTVCQFSLKELNKQGRPIYRQEDFWADIKEITNDLERSECPLNVDLSNLKELYNKIFNNEKLFLFIYGKTFEVVENGYYILNKTVKNSLDSHSASVDSNKDWNSNEKDYGTSVGGKDSERSYGYSIDSSKGNQADGNSFRRDSVTDGVSVGGGLSCDAQNDSKSDGHTTADLQDSVLASDPRGSSCCGGFSRSIVELHSIKETTISIISIEENDVLISKQISDFYYNGMTSCIEAESFTVPIFDKIPVGYVGPYVLRINTDLEDFNKNLEILKSKFLKYEHIKLFELKNGKK